MLFCGCIQALTPVSGLKRSNEGFKEQEIFSGTRYRRHLQEEKAPAGVSGFLLLNCTDMCHYPVLMNPEWEFTGQALDYCFRGDGQRKRCMVYGSVLTS